MGFQRPSSDRIFRVLLLFVSEEGDVWMAGRMEKSHFHIYIVDNKCSMYAMTYRNDSIVKQNFKQSNLYGLLQNINGTTYGFPEPFNSSFGIHSPYLKINRISCNGCARIQQAKCTTSTKVAEGINPRPPIISLPMQ